MSQGRKISNPVRGKFVDEKFGIARLSRGWQARTVASLPTRSRIDPYLYFRAQRCLTLTRDVTYPIILGGFRNIRSIRRGTSPSLSLNHIKPSNSRDRAFLDDISVEVAWFRDKFLFSWICPRFRDADYIYIYTHCVESWMARHVRPSLSLLEMAGNDIISSSASNSRRGINNPWLWREREWRGKKEKEKV